MHGTKLIAAAAIALSSSPLLAGDTLPEGIWTNTEDEYFAEEEGREKPAWVALEIGSKGEWRRIDAFGQPQTEWSDAAIPGLTFDQSAGWQINGSELRRAKPLTCWVAVRKFAVKPNGDEDWTFSRNLKIFDQGGRSLIAGEGVAPDVTIRVRNVTWAKGSRNKPVRALYIHKQDPVRAESYSWGAPDTSVIGINLRWVQASCSEQPSEIERQR